LAFRLEYGCDSRCGFRRRFLRFCCGAWSGEWEMGVCQPGHDPYKNAELDRNKICNFQVHFAKPFQAMIKMTETKENLFLQSCEDLMRNRAAKQRR
jgi:hypothetical protein